MRIAYLDCFAGISGDMLLGALLDAGVPPQVLHDATATLNLNSTLKIEKVDRSGITSTKVHVFEGTAPAELHTHEHSHADEPHSHEPHTHSHEHTHADGHTHTHEHTHESHSHEHTHESHSHEPHSHEPHTHSHEHNHADGHTLSHEHTHEHTHGRSLSVIRTLIQSAPLADPIKQTALRAFELLGHSEAKIHNVPVEKIHFHEVGAVDAIVDIVAASAGIHHLQIDAWFCSPLNVGGGMVECAHGTFPVPAPATADLLRGVPTYSAHIQKELVTPTGAALLRALNPTFTQQPAMTVAQIGYGAGSRNPKDFPNVLRLSVGESAATTPTETVTILETALDDLSPQLLAHVAETALTLGALDIMLTPTIMKKGRPGTLVTILCNDTERPSLERLLLTETTTLGIRIRHDQRTILDRTHATVATEYGDIRIKIGSLKNETLNAAPEFEDCKRAAQQHNVPLKQVQQAAIAAHISNKL